MKRPSRNIPMRTVIVAAIVVERFDVTDRSASERKRRACCCTRGPPGDTCPPLARDHAAPDATLGLAQAPGLACGRVRPLAWCSRPRTWTASPEGALSAVAAAALVADDDAVVERDDAPAHLVDHLAVVRRHDDRRAGAVDPVEELHDPD